MPWRQKVPAFYPMRRTVNGLPKPTDFYGTRYWIAATNLNAPKGIAVQLTDHLSGDDSRVIMDRAIPFAQDTVSDGESVLYAESGSWANGGTSIQKLFDGDDA